MPFLSIIVPVYNKEDYIESSIESILNQTFSDFELILVNDGSTDQSGRICDHYQKTDQRVVVVHQSNQGVSTARNTGLDVSTGRYIGFVDCDDELETDMYDLLISNALYHNADVSICGIKKIFPDKTVSLGGSNSVKIYNSDQALTGLLKKEFPRSVYDKIYLGANAKKVKFEGSIYEDTLYNFMVLAESKKIVYHDMLKYNYIIRENSVSMAKFSKKYIDSITVSGQILDICKAKRPDHIGEAINFDFVTNLSLLNIILISEKANYIEDYRLVSSNLVRLSKNLNGSATRAKHKYAFALFKCSPFIYEFMMKLYCEIAKADISKRK
ncbi:glycosyltransferase [Dyadobacter psychrophilus]|uniref:Glycosyl transferase family 2 n=1 Tax=Dyadobacter psychrophilus TaxID=651661 RepID=A0A1T5HE48_9BACT|nr:glycosyltransferase [Dyadobacter psychrophilus]SKC18975.1 Glycosyl transferase family 2 [Dyadobacter psychrophilus]